jgi:hypothetical protein
MTVIVSFLVRINRTTERGANPLSGQPVNIARR